MAFTKDILNHIEICYNNINLTKITALKNYAEFLCDAIDSKSRHTSAIGLHTGSVYYQAMSVAVSAIGCLFYHNTDNADLIKSLNIGDMLIIDGERVRFKGIKDGIEFGIGFNAGDKYFIIECDNKKTRWLPLSEASKLNIALYRGEAEKLGGRGVRSTLKTRKEFLHTFFNGKLEFELSTEVNQSIALIMNRNLVEKLYRGIYFLFYGKKFLLSEIVTATYYSLEDSYQIGNNPTKEEPVLKFFSNVSACRNTIIDDKQNRIIGCLIGDENLWVSNNEIYDLVDRKSLKFVLMLGKTNYIKFRNWYESDIHSFYAIVPEIARDTLNKDELLLMVKDLNDEIVSFSHRSISSYYVNCGIDPDTISEIKKRLLQIKKECTEDNEKDRFLMESYFLLNLCRSAFFPLSYFDQANERNWTLSEKLKLLSNYEASLIGESKENAKFICENISKIVLELYHSNPKGEIIKTKLCDGEFNCIVATKSYFEKMFLLWLNDCNLKVKPKIITLSTFEKKENSLTDVVFTTPYYNQVFNPYASFDFKSAEVLCYEYEKSRAEKLMQDAESGRRLLREKNATTYVIAEQPKYIKFSDRIEDIEYEAEMNKMSHKLALTKVNEFMPSQGVNKTKIEKILTFDSGCVGYFTKFYKGYVLREDKVVETELDNLNIGDYMVFTKQSENRDIVDLLLNQLLGSKYKDTAYPEYYSASTRWKKELRQYKLINNLTYSQLSNRLRCYACVKHPVTIRVWLDESSYVVGPRELSDYEAIVQLLKMDSLPEEIKNSCDKIRELRTKILDTLGKAIIHGMFAETKDLLSDFVCERVGNLSQIEQITGIMSSEMVDAVPIYMANKPINMEDE